MSVPYPIVDSLADKLRKAEEAVQNYDFANLSVGANSEIANYGNAKDGQNQGSLAAIATPKGNGIIDIVGKYQWTVSSTNRSDIPHIYLDEHKVEGGSIQKQFAFYGSGISDATEDFLGNGSKYNFRGILDVYDEIFVPNETKFKYYFPYFSKVNYELTTSQWQQFDSISQSVGQITSGIGKLFGKTGEKISNFLNQGIELASAGAQTALQFKYPVVGIADRPRIFTAHNERSITIEFPLYNTLRENEWKRNKDFIQLFMYQNMFNKRNFITGLPPCWYKVTIPGSYYSVASCVTNFTVENLGNIREINQAGKNFIVPDAYQVRITLQEMAMPSKNQFQYAITGENLTDSSEVFSEDNPPVVDRVESAARANGILPPEANAQQQYNEQPAQNFRPIQGP